MNSQKIGTVFLIAILSLSGIGITFAGWTDVITVTGTVHTGTVEFHVTEYSGTWVWKHIPTHQKMIHEGIPEDIDGDGIADDDPDGFYGNDEYELVASSYAYQEIMDEHVKFSFENLYPCVLFEANFKFKIGTIPVILATSPDDSMLWFNQLVNDIQTNWVGNLIPEHISVQILDEDGETVWPNYNDLVQLHPGIEYEWILTVHIPQDNAYMNCYAEAELTMDIIQWSDPCYKVVKVPAEMTVTFAHYGDDSYWDVTIDDLPDFGGPWSPPLEEGAIINGWCVDQGTTLPDGQYDVNVHYNGKNGQISRETLWPGNPQNAPSGIGPWDCIDYIINHKGSYDRFEIQDAIWYYVNGGTYPTDPEAQAIIAEVESNGYNWISDGHPITGELAGVLIDPSTNDGHNKQYIIIEVDP